jgi:hypothetical protein
MTVNSDCTFCALTPSKVAVFVAVTCMASERVGSMAAATVISLHDAIKNAMATARLSRFICSPFCLEALPC